MNNLKDEVYQKIGARIREVRIEKKMSQADLAEKAHMSLPHISEIELGRQECFFPPSFKSRRLCKFLPIRCFVQTLLNRRIRRISDGLFR